MRKQYILLSTVCCGLYFGSDVSAQCVTTRDCGVLGYKQSSCTSGKGIKCPFGETWYCPCDASYIFTCTGTNESPSAAKCGDKYSMCNCATGTHWDTDKCVADRASCSIGWIYYVDGTCAAPAEHTGRKTALGVVIYVNPDGVGGQVMSAWPVSENGQKTTNNDSTMVWSTKNVNISTLPDYTSAAHLDYDSCGNTDKIIAQGDAKNYPAAWAARKYAPTVISGQKWCLPAAGVAVKLVQKRNDIDEALLKIGGVELPDCCLWSSTEVGAETASKLDLTQGLDRGYKNINKYPVRPVLEF